MNRVLRPVLAGFHVLLLASNMGILLENDLGVSTVFAVLYLGLMQVWWQLMPARSW